MIGIFLLYIGTQEVTWKSISLPSRLFYTLILILDDRAMIEIDFFFIFLSTYARFTLRRLEISIKQVSFIICLII